MTYSNLIYLALITERVPILGPFSSNPHTGAIGSFPVGSIFDLPRLRKSLGRPVLEFHDVKNPQSDVLDELGCWSIWMSVQSNEPYPRGASLPDLLNLGEYRNSSNFVIFWKTSLLSRYILHSRPTCHKAVSKSWRFTQHLLGASTSRLPGRPAKKYRCSHCSFAKEQSPK